MAVPQPAVPPVVLPAVPLLVPPLAVPPPAALACASGQPARWARPALVCSCCQEACPVRRSVRSVRYTSGAASGASCTSGASCSVGSTVFIIRDQDIGRTTKTNLEAGRRCRPGRSGAGASE